MYFISTMIKIIKVCIKVCVFALYDYMIYMIVLNIIYYS